MLLNNKNTKHNIVSSFNKNPKLEFGVYAKGYHFSAKILAENFISKNGYGDYEGYPIVFLYRHSFELYLKNIIYQCQILSKYNKGNKGDDKLYNSHNLIDLAKQGSELLLNIFEKNNLLKKICQKILKTANEYFKIDKDSYAYRYPIDKFGNYSTKAHQTISIFSIYETMEEILTEIEAINLGINIEKDKKMKIIEILEKYSMN